MSGSESEEPAGLGRARAIQLATEVMVAPFIGLGMGYGLDRWLGTRPWFLIIFLIFGVAAGFLNLYRAMNPQADH